MTIRRIYGPEKFFLTVGESKEVWGKFSKEYLGPVKQLKVASIEMNENDLVFVGEADGRSKSLAVRSSGVDPADYQSLCLLLKSPLDIESPEVVGKYKLHRNSKVTSISIGDRRHHVLFPLVTTALGVVVAVCIGSYVL
jgi:hypothetical protein